MEMNGTYEIVRKQSDNTTMFVEVVKGIEEAQKRVNELNGSSASEYFIFDPEKASVVDPLQPDIAMDPFSL